jgi:Flp pilus assembly protein TadD
MIGGFVSAYLRGDRLAHAAKFEAWARRGLELDPKNCELRATLGAVLVESRRYTEAEPLLVKYLDKVSASASQAFALFYLGVIHSVQGNKQKAAKLMRQAILLSRDKWLIDRAEATLVGITQPNLKVWVQSD